MSLTRKYSNSAIIIFLIIFGLIYLFYDQYSGNRQCNFDTESEALAVASGLINDSSWKYRFFEEQGLEASDASLGYRIVKFEERRGKLEATAWVGVYFPKSEEEPVAVFHLLNDCVMYLDK